MATDAHFTPNSPHAAMRSTKKLALLLRVRCRIGVGVAMDWLWALRKSCLPTYMGPYYMAGMVTHVIALAASRSLWRGRMIQCRLNEGAADAAGANDLHTEFGVVPGTTPTMRFSSLPLEILRLIVKSMELRNIRSLSCTSRYMRIATVDELRSQTYFTFSVNQSFRNCYAVVCRLLHLIEHPHLVRHVRRASTIIEDSDPVRCLKTHEIEDLCGKIQTLSLNSSSHSRDLRTILHVLESSVARSNNIVGWSQLCANILLTVLWLCPNVEELRMSTWFPSDCSRQMNLIGSHIGQLQKDDLSCKILEPFDDLRDRLNIARLSISILGLSILSSQHQNGFDVLLAPSVRQIELEQLFVDDWARDYFWPPGCQRICSAIEVIVDFKIRLPSPLVLAHFLDRCSDLQRFELHCWRVCGEEYDALAYVEAVNRMANVSLAEVGRPSIAGLAGFVDLVRGLMGPAFELVEWDISYFQPCVQPAHDLMGCTCVMRLEKRKG